MRWVTYFLIGALSFIAGAAAISLAGPKESLRASTVHLPNCTGAVVQSPYSETKYVLTNWHCCHSYDPKLVVKADAGKDLCALHVDQTKPALKVSEHPPVHKAHLYTRGWPWGEMRESQGIAEYYERLYINFAKDVKHCPKELHVTYVKDRITECSGVYDFLRTTLYCEPGSSGSPILNEYGELVSVLQTWEGPSNVRSGGGVPLEAIRAFFKSL